MSGGNCGAIRALKIFPMPTLLWAAAAAAGGEGGLAEMDAVEASTGHHIRDRQAVTGLELWPPTSPPPTSLTHFSAHLPLDSLLGHFTFCLTRFPAHAPPIFHLIRLSLHLPPQSPLSSPPTTSLNPSPPHPPHLSAHLWPLFLHPTHIYPLSQDNEGRKEGRKESDAWESPLVSSSLAPLSLASGFKLHKNPQKYESLWRQFRKVCS